MPRPRKPASPFRYFNSSPEVIRLVVMMYVRFPLSLPNVADLLFMPVSREPGGRAATQDRTRCDGYLNFLGQLVPSLRRVEGAQSLLRQRGLHSFASELRSNPTVLGHLVHRNLHLWLPNSRSALPHLPDG